MTARHLTTETVEGTALALEGVDNVEGGDGLALGVLGVGDGVTDDALEEGLQDTARLLVDHCAPPWLACVETWRPMCGRADEATYWPRYA